jgi:2-polyprenyl-6-methoxyphenol hydroxylase-like FAD-dependent oxidoreductase
MQKQLSLFSGVQNVEPFRYWNYVSEKELDHLLTDVDGQRHSDALPANKLRPEVWEEQKDRARTQLPPQFAKLVTMTEQPFVQTITDMAVPQVAHGRVAMIGESAFIPRPHTAASADQAL